MDTEQQKKEKKMCGDSAQIPIELRRSWDENERLSKQLVLAQKENGGLRQENTELQERLDAMTENFRRRTTQFRENRGAKRERSKANDISQ